MKCSYCDCFIPADSLYCPWCGMKVSEAYDDKSCIQDVTEKNYNRVQPVFNIMDSSYYSPRDFIDFVKEDNIKAVQKLINAGFYSEIRDANTRTALMLAALNDYLDMAEMLINNGANIDAKDDNGYTPYDYARSESMRNLLTKNRTKATFW